MSGINQCFHQKLFGTNMIVGSQEKASMKYGFRHFNEIFKDFEGHKISQQTQLDFRDPSIILVAIVPFISIFLLKLGSQHPSAQ